LNPDQRARHFYAALWCFLFQIVILSLVFYETVIFPTDYELKVYSLTVYVAQFMAGLLVHLDLVMHVKEAITKIKYINNNPEEFISIGVPLLTCGFQLVASLYNEFINMLMLTTRTSVEYCITHFIAFEVIAAIGNIYVENLQDFPLKHETHHTPLKNMNRSQNIDWSTRTFTHKVLRVVYKILRCFFCSIYYYFVSYLIIIIPFLVNLTSYTKESHGSLALHR